jgi:hypothetical protein
MTRERDDTMSRNDATMEMLRQSLLNVANGTDILVLLYAEYSSLRSTPRTPTTVVQKWWLQLSTPYIDNKSNLKYVDRVHNSVDMLQYRYCNIVTLPRC